MSRSVREAGDRRERGLAALTHGYYPFPGVYDEMMDAEGVVRPHWRRLLETFAGLGRTELERRFATADRQLRDSGVFYRVYDDPADVERPWPLAHVPLIIEPSEWEALSAGLIQRARLLDAVLADAYGPGRLVANGHLPAAVIAGSTDFLRPLVGVTPVGGSHLRLYAADLGRGPDGRWWVISDRAQAPSGAGYALENRIALSRALPDVFQDFHVRRLADFFRGWQNELNALTRSGDARVCMLTPGALNETYFEHAYLARYLGFLLVEGADLTVRDNEVFIRTVSGLKRADVLWRRLDSDFADPLELNSRSHLGVPGLVQAVRAGNVALANALGAGVIESKALLSFLPTLARPVLGSELTIPNVATWWCGQPLEREAVIADIDSFAIAPAFHTPPIGQVDGITLPANLDEQTRERLIRSIRTRGVDYVAQEVVKLSTMPVWRAGRLEPRPFVLRLYVARIGDDWQVMPGGFCRLSDEVDARAVGMQRGSRTADVWVLSPQKVAPTTLLPRADKLEVKRTTGSLPSRAADNLYWLARYLERAEATLRLLRALVGRAPEADGVGAAAAQHIIEQLVNWGTLDAKLKDASASVIATAVLGRRDRAGSLPGLVRLARNAAAVIRDRFSPDAWRALTDLDALVCEPLDGGGQTGDIYERINQALRIISSFSGLAQENMNQLTGWRFLDLGRRIERAVATCRYVRHFADAGEGALETLLELADSQITYRMRYVMSAARGPVVDLVMLDSNNPRSVGYQVSRIAQHLAQLPGHRQDGRLNAAERIAVRLATELETTDAQAVGEALLARTERALLQLSDEISQRFFTHREIVPPPAEGLA